MGDVDDMDDAVDRFAVLFDQHYDPVLRYACRRTDQHTAEDVAADVFLVAWRRPADVPDRPLPWLIGIARRLLANQRRGDHRRTELQRRLRSECPVETTDHTTRLDVATHWRLALESLPVGDQEVLTLLAWDGLTTADAADSLDCTVPAFIVRVSRARRRLAQALHEIARDAATPPATPARKGTMP